MPFGDGTGPRGMGPMTGRGAGYCSGFSGPGFANPVPRRGLGLGWSHRRFTPGGYGFTPPYGQYGGDYYGRAHGLWSRYGHRYPYYRPYW